MLEVLRAYPELHGKGQPDRFAFEAALTVYFWHHPLVPAVRVGSAMLLLLVRLFGILFDLAGKVAQHVDHVLVAGLFDRLVYGSLDHGDGNV
jgi:hypothetical protein